VPFDSACRNPRVLSGPSSALDVKDHVVKLEAVRVSESAVSQRRLGADRSSDDPVTLAT
jgi:hypothetical protein